MPYILAPPTISGKEPFLLLSVTMSGKESKAYKSVLACITDITNCLRVNSAAKDALNVEYLKWEWISVATTLNEKQLVEIVLDRIATDAGQYNIFMEMLANIAEMNLIVDKLKGTGRFLNSNMMIMKYMLETYNRYLSKIIAET